MDTRTWILDRASYADMYLDDIFQDPGFYSAVLEADLIFCEQAGFAGVPTSRSAQCRLVGNSYFSRSASRSWWPLLKAFDVAVDFNLAIRPQFQGKQRVIPCTCQATNTGTADITVTVHKSSFSLSLECSNLSALIPEGSVLRENEHAPLSAGRGGYAMIGATAPGFYVIPDLPLPEHQSDRKRIQSGDSIKNKATQSSSYTPESATKAMGIPESPDRHVACTLSRALWARYCHGNPRRWHAAVLSMSKSHGIIRRAPAATDPDPPKHPLAGLFVALGMLVLFSGLALAGALIRRHLEKRARLGVARAASLEELWAASADELDTRPRYVRLLQRIQIVFAWADWVADRFNQKQSQAIELNKVKEGGGPRKLQKTKGTRFEDPTDLRPQVMPPASEIPIGRPIDQSFDIEKRPDDRIGDNMDQGSAEYMEGISTAQEHRSRNAAIRRSNRSTGVPDGHEENL